METIHAKIHAKIHAPIHATRCKNPRTNPREKSTHKIHAQICARSSANLTDLRNSTRYCRTNCRRVYQKRCKLSRPVQSGGLSNSGAGGLYVWMNNNVPPHWLLLAIGNRLWYHRVVVSLLRIADVHILLFREPNWSKHIFRNYSAIDLYGNCFVCY